MLMKILRSPYFTWFLLAIPSFMMMRGYFSGRIDAHGLLHPSGEFSARAMILALFCTPLVVLWPKVKVFRSLMKRRRYIGVAAFGYALLHTLFYLIDEGSFDAVITEALELSIWTGWVAFLIFIPLAMTSNDTAVKALGGRKWKNLQRFVYVAAVLTAAHWLFLEYQVGPLLVHFAPLAILEAARIWKQSRKPGVTATT
ncbi:MAG: protein-methionine-sulfoxide reductase heme-binding subunit MsrQ [Parasphingorhabdus sp.]